MKKDTVYIDNDDEITSISDKVQSAKSDIVALVLPKRCTVLQSSVNMKILNRAASNSGKKLVLITSEAALLPVAGSAGVFVAKTLQSKPAVPPSPQYEETIDTISDAEGDEPDLDKAKSIGELAGATAVAAAAVSADDDENPIELGDEPDEPSKTDKTKDAAEKKNKKLKVPNFDSFRIKLFAVIGGIIILGALWYVATNVLPRAVITITTENKAIPVKLTVTGSTAVKAIDVDNKIVPAQTKTLDKTETKKFTATGEKNVGNKASGTMTIFNCTDNAITVPAGAVFTNGAYSFATTTSSTITASNFKSDGECKEDGFLAGVAVTATGSGDQYNLSANRIYTSNIASTVYGKGSAMSGGTNKIVKVVSVTDCETAKNELLNTKTDAYKTELTNQLTAAGLTPLPETFTVESTKVSCNPDVNAEATEATATATFKSTMTGVNTAGIDQLIQADVAKNLQGSQSIFDTGSKTATLTVKERKTNGEVVFTLQTEAQTGIKQDANVIAASVAGKKRGETVSTLESQPGVSSVTVEYKPFWVSGTPKNVKHITVKFVSNGNK